MTLLAVGLFLACFTVPAQTVRVIDGDTADMRLGIWLGHVVVERVRVLGVDTPELKGDTKPAAERARAFTAAWLAQGEVEVHACRRDAFGRVLGKVRRGAEDLAEALIRAGHGRPR